MKALLLVDIQNDFLPGGNLAVSNGYEIIPIVNELQKRFNLIIATKDWHPADHKSFATQHYGKSVGDIISLHGHEQVLWPDHCVQNSYGSEFPMSLNTDKINKIFFKGIERDIDSYSAFLDNDKKRETGLREYLINKNIDEIFIVGLATDYCVKFTAVDGKNSGFTVNVIEDACKGVNIRPEDSESTLKELQNHGINIIRSSFLLDN